jgi:hypothetical protein
LRVGANCAPKRLLLIAPSLLRRRGQENQKENDKNLQGMLKFVGVNPEGYVDNNGYDETKEIAGKIKAQWIAESETEAERKDVEENFPLQEREEID